MYKKLVEAVEDEKSVLVVDDIENFIGRGELVCIASEEFSQEDVKPEVIQPIRGNLTQVKVEGKGNRIAFLPEFQKPVGDKNRSSRLSRAYVPEEGAEAWLVATWCVRPTDQFLDDICHRC